MKQLSPTRNRAFATEVVTRLHAAGFQALWAGGCVRDLVMGNSPEDYDVATSATPDQVRKLFGSRHTLAVGAAFGVIVVLAPQRDALPVEVATFRTDASYSDGRRPDSIAFSTAEHDAQRRDFTINGMFFDPLTAVVIDYVGGQEDLQRRLIRAIGDADARIGEDKLRMLRAIRFAARFAFVLESSTLAAICRHADSLTVVSGERISVETQKTLLTSRAAWAVDTWATTGLMRVIMPELDWGAVREPVMQLLAQCQSLDGTCSDWRTRFAALILAAGGRLQTAEDTNCLSVWLNGLRERLRWSNDDFQTIDFAVRVQPQLRRAEDIPWSQIQPLLINPHFPQALELLTMQSHLDSTLDATVSWLRQRADWPTHQLDPRPLLDGADLVRLGFRPGPTFKELLSQVRNLQLDGALVDRAAALKWVQSQSSPP